MIDTSAESAESLRLLAVLLTSYAGIKDAEAGIDRTAGQSVAHTVQAATAALNANTQALTVTAPQPDVDLSAVDPTAIFGKNAATVPQGTSNVLPFPGAPTLPAVTAAVVPPVSDTPASNAQGATLPLAQTATVELDAAGLPWDARIHQSNRNKKTDGTWMLKRGLDKTLAATVLAELTAAKQKGVDGALAAVGAVAAVVPPVTLPPPPVNLPLPPTTVGPATGPVVLGTLPPPPTGAALPAVPNGLPAQLPAALTPVQRFSAMMVKINAAKASGQIDQNMIDEAHKALDLPQLQLAITQPDKIPLIEAALGL